MDGKKDEHFHCSTCYNFKCSLNDKCELVDCRLKCGARMHECKMDDHCEEVCSRTPIDCPNRLYGCNVLIIRSHLANHLKICNAYTLYCNFSWNRSFVSVIAKRFFKRVAKELEETKSFDTDLSNADSEVLMALEDQKQVFGSFKCSRLCRVKQRDYSNRTHPLLPLSYKQVAAVYMPKDSSDEEVEEEQTFMRSIPQAFAECPICKTDRGEQHYHILGNINSASNNDDPNVKLPQNTSNLPLELLLPMSNLKYKLFLNLEYGRVNARTMSDAKLYHMYCCGQLIRRNEYSHHQRYHMEISHSEQSRFIRCQYGCGFGAEKYRPSKGQFKYKPFFGAIVHTDVTAIERPENFDWSLLKLMAGLSMADAYLDTATLNALAATCSWIRENIFDYFPHRYLIYKNWIKQRYADGRIEWKMGEPRRKFSKVQLSNWTIIQNPKFSGELESHKRECSCKDLNYTALPTKDANEYKQLMDQLVEKLKLCVI